MSMGPHSIPGALKDLVGPMLCGYITLLHLRANIFITALLWLEKTRKSGFRDVLFYSCSLQRQRGTGIRVPGRQQPHPRTALHGHAKK